MPERHYGQRTPLWSMILGSAVDAVFAGTLVWLVISGDYSEGWGSQDVVISLILVLLAVILANQNATKWRLWSQHPEGVTLTENDLASNTGVWRTNLDEVAFSVRWDGMAGHYWVDGSLNGMTVDWEPWMDSVTLAEIIEREETAGRRPEDSEATRAIRARLMVAGWNDYDREDSL